jgi:hypothetical protein
VSARTGKETEMHVAKSTRWVLCMVLAGALSGCKAQAQDPGSLQGAPAPGRAGAPGLARTLSTVKYSLGDTATVRALYPDASWVPDVYKPQYQQLDLTIQHFTEQSLQRDGIAYESVTVSVDDTVTIEIATSDERARAYAIMHPAFLDQKHAVQGLHGITLCQNTPGCWENHNPKPTTEPWAFYLPLGLPLANTQAVMLLNYPPATSLTDRDYLDNFTLKRWKRILAAVGIEQPYLYEAIVDVLPIAAPGSGQADYLPDPIAYFDTPTSDESSRFYITPMIELLTDPPANQDSPSTLPMIVLGGPARATWGKVIDYQGTKAQVPVLGVGTVTLQGSTRQTAWVAGNHPVATAYQCCPGDPYKGCNGSFDLVQDEQIDLQVACIAMALGQDPSMDPALAKQQCQAQWGQSFSSLSTASQRTICIQAKLDNDNRAAQCRTPAAAEAYCDAHGNDACATYDCK